MREVRLEDFGGGPGDMDNTPAMNAVTAAAILERGIRLQLGAGSYRFASKPDDFTACVKIAGVDLFRSRLVRSYSEATGDGFLTWRELASASDDPEVGNTIRASELLDCQVICAGDSVGGTMVQVVTDGPVTGWFRLVRVKISHNKLGGGYVRALRMDGRKNLKQGGQGLRDCSLESVFLFPAPGAVAPVAQFLNCTNLNASFWCGGDVLVSGSGDKYGSSTYGRLWVEIIGSLTYDYAARYTSYGNVGGAVVKTANAVSCTHR
jgi:hypothetical protein